MSESKDSQGGFAGAKRVVMVAAVAENGVIGADGDIPWKISADLQHFRAVTRGNSVVMGRATYESIGHPLPYRTNIVLTRDQSWVADDGVLVAHDLDEALRFAEGAEGQVMIIGGAQIYELAMAHADEQILTEVHQAPQGDTYYPEWSRDEWVETRRDSHPEFDFVWWRRR